MSTAIRTVPVDNLHAEVEIKPQLKPRGSVVKEEDQNRPTTCTSCWLNPHDQLGRLHVYKICKRSLRAPTEENTEVLMLVCREREAIVILHPILMTQQYHLASMTARLSPTGISHYSLLPHLPSIHLSTVNSSPHPGIAPQSLNSSSQPLHLPGDLCPCSGYEWLRQGLSDSHSI